MERVNASNGRIFHSISYPIVFILFILTAVFLEHPHIVHAEGMNIGQVSNISSYGTNEADESSNEQAGYLYWAASGERCGVMFYVIDDLGRTQVQGVLLDDAGVAEWGEYADAALGQNPNYIGVNRLIPRTGNNVFGLGMSIQYVPGVSPVYYSGGWQAKGSDAMEFLMADSGAKVKLKGVVQELPNWAYYVAMTGPNGVVSLERLAKSDTKWQVILEPVSVNYLYTGDYFTQTTIDASGMEWTAGSPVPASSYGSPVFGIADGWRPMVYIGTAYSLISSSNAVTGTTGGGQYTYKFYNTQLPYSLCLDHDIEVPIFSESYENVLTTPFEGLHSSVHRISSIGEIGSEGIAMASIDISGFALPPLHTYYEANGTPGNTEPPSEENGTDGDCTIKKLYYTQELSSDGTILTEAKDYHPYTQTSTTAYISIDTESNYEIEGWKTSTTNTTLNTKEQFNSITPTTHTGTSSQEILLDQDTGEKYLYILYKKTEVNPNPPQPYDFQLQQSQITKRVSFMTPDANSTTQQLFTHNFTWTAPAPTKTSCTANSNKGHLKCTTSEHTHSDSCYTEDADGNKSLTCTTSEHTHTDSCYEKCSSWKWTDNTTSLGITLDTSSLNKAVVSKNDSITYNQPAVNTITSSNKYNKDNTSTRSGTSQDTQSISNFNYITVLFRGQDHLTLADWKNGGAISYLTNLAYDSAYNFKSANTPQGTRKSGTEYNETFATRFINRSPDMSTTYKATVGSAGICSTTSSSYRFDTDFTINDIVVNDPAGFIFLHIFRTTDIYRYIQNTLIIHQIKSIHM